jgi:hypothetical protein
VIDASIRGAIFWPVVFQVAVSCAVVLRVLIVRVAEMRARRIAPQSVATSREVAARLDNLTAADNLRNLFELPVLFYAACLALAVTHLVTPLQLGLAWGFVALRASHSLIQTTYNRVMHRFAVFMLGFLCLMAMWIVFAVQLARAPG